MQEKAVRAGVGQGTQTPTEAVRAALSKAQRLPLKCFDRTIPRCLSSFDDAIDGRSTGWKDEAFMVR